MNSISDRCITKIAKLIGVSLPEKIKKEEIEQILKTRGKYEDFVKISTFTTLSGRDDINEFMFKVKKVVETHIKSSSFYKEVVEEEIKKQTNEIRKKLRFNQISSYGIDQNDGKTYLSFDIQSANFTALKLISGGIISETWPEFLKRLFPLDVRSESKKNVELKVAGLSVEVPDCLYESKFFRQFLLGDLKKLRFIWELENLKYLASICESGIDNPICVNSDELVIEVKDQENALVLMQILPKSNMHRSKIFELKKLDGYKKNYLLKVFSDGSKQLMNVDPLYYDELFKKFVFHE